MDSQAYLDLLRSRLQRYYDFKELDSSLCFDLCAELNVSDEGYFLVPALKTFSASHNEFLYAVVVKEPLTEDFMKPYLDFVELAMKNMKPKEDHMSSVYSLVFICECSPEPVLVEKYAKYKFHKDYMFTLRGWSDLALYLVDVPQGELSFNKAAKKNVAYFKIS